MTINKKLFRDIKEHLGANVAAVIVIAIGIMIFNGAATTMDTLITSKDVAYQQGNFPHAYATLITGPETITSALEKMEGIETVEGRLVQDLKIKDTAKTLRLISGTSKIGKYVLEEGRYPKSGDMEILLGDRFAATNGYRIGDTLPLISRGRVHKVRVCGIATSPETIYTIKDSSALFPDPEEFGVAFSNKETVQKITGKEFFNEILFQFDRATTFDQLKNRIEKQLRPYGLISLYAMKDQSSNLIIEGEIKELKATMILMPLIFLGVATLVMAIMIKRIIEQQRGQIGILKAFGYTNLEVGLHFSSYCLILGVAGGILGGIMGHWFAGVMLKLYKDFFNLKFINDTSFFQYFGIGIVISGGFSVLAGLKASQNAVQIAPADAMREEVPQGGAKSFVEKFPFFDYIFSAKGKMSVRNISRNKKRSFFVVMGLAFAFSISILPWTMLSMMQEMIFDQFKYVEKYDAKIFLSDFGSKADLERALRGFPGVILAQGMTQIPATLRHQGVTEEVSILGITKDSRLYIVRDENKEILSVEPGGIVLSERLSEKLGVRQGDRIWVKSPYGKDKEDEKAVMVSVVIGQGVGMNGYMENESLSSVLGYEPIANNIIMDVDGKETIQNLRTTYQDSEKVMGIQSKEEAIAQVEKRMEAMYSSMYFMAFIAAAMSFAIVYNTFIVVLSERKREFSTLMILGMGEKEVLSIISLEQWLMSLLGVCIGIPIAKTLITVMSKELSTDMFTMPTDMKWDAIVIAGVLMGISIIAAQILAARKMNHIDIVEVLKAGE